MMNPLLLFIAIIWTTIMLGYIPYNFFFQKKKGWLKNPSQKLAFLTFVITHIVLGITIWGNAFSWLKPHEFLLIISIGILFFFLMIGFNILARKDFLIDLNKKYPINKT